MTQETQFDLAIIGSGPGGYVAAAHAAQHGFKTAVVEKASRLGGVCLNVGCIPSKAMLDASEFYHLARERFSEFGIKTGDVELDLPTMLARKDKVVEDLTQNLKRLLEGNKITIVHGAASLSAPGKVAVETAEGEKLTLSAKYILLATGSAPIEIKGLEFDGEYIVSSTEALSFSAVPENLGIVGGGVIGLELGSVWNRLGSKVTVIEMLPKLGAGLDGQVARSLDRFLKRQGMTFKMGTKVAEASVSGNGVKAVLEKGDAREEMTFDRLLVCIGRRPLTKGLGLDVLGVKTDPKTGQVIVDETYQTNVPGVYAIGDLIPGPMLAHKASAEGIAAVECMLGREGEVNYDAIPNVIYTWPEVGCVGLTEQQAREREIPHSVGSFPFSGVGRARCMGDTDGFVKLIAHKETDRVLGVHIIGPRASELIAECVLAMEMGAASEDIARTVHAHPTLAEGVMEAAMKLSK